MKRRRGGAHGPTYKIFKSKHQHIWDFRVPKDIRPNTFVVPYIQEPWESPDEKDYLGFRCSNKNEFVRGLASRIKSLWDFQSRVEYGNVHKGELHVGNLHVGKLQRILVQEEGSSEWKPLYEDPDCKPLGWVRKGKKLQFNLVCLDDIPPATCTDTHLRLLMIFIGRKYGLPEELCFKIWEYVTHAYNFIPVYRPKARVV